MQSQSGALPRLVNCLFEGVTKPQRFAEGLRLLAEMLDCEQMSIKLWDRRGSWACVRRARRLDGGWQLFTEELSAPQSEWRKLAASVAPGSWNRVTLGPEIPDALRPESPISTLAGRPSSGDLICLRISIAKGADGLLLIGQRAQQDSGEACCLQLPTELIKSVMTSLELMVQFRQLNYRAGCASVLLDTIRLPLLMLDHSLRLLAANRHAHALIEHVAMATGKRSVSLKGLPASRFSIAVREACQHPASRLGSILLIGGQQEASRQVLVLPIVVPHAGKPSRAALVLVHDHAGVQASSQLLLQQAYGLTPAEARLTMLLLEGQTPVDAAVSLQVSVATVRTQLSAVLKKTGARKQAELIRRLSPLLVLDRQQATH